MATNADLEVARSVPVRQAGRAADKNGCMMRWYDDYLRWLYRGGRPNFFARLQNRASGIAFAAGIWPKRVAALEVRGRRSGRVISFPVVIADYENERYLVSMLGEEANWVRMYERRAATPCFGLAAAKPYASRRSPQQLGRRSCVATWNGR